MDGRAEGLPVVVIGAGPIGLAAAAHLVNRGEAPLVLEAGSRIGSSIAEWSHVRLFSPWRYLVDAVAGGILEATGWRMPDPDGIPTGGELLSAYLEPLAAVPAIGSRVLLEHRVLSISRRGFDKVRSVGRESAPFELVVSTPAGERRILARAVIDASGTYRTPNPLGASGLVAEGEREHVSRIRYGIPDVLRAERERYAGRRTVVVGSGHSAFNALLELAQLAEEAAGGEVVWAIRRREVGQLFGGGSKDALPARGSLGTRMLRLLEEGRVRLVTGFRATGVSGSGRGVLLHGEEQVIGPVDEVVVTTGFRPDLELTRELRLSLDPWLEAPVALAPMIDPNVHSCGTVYPHGAAELGHPEEGFFTVGMKSYGRAPTFLLLTGYEQVRSVVCQLTGDLEGAREVRLVLPETGVCSTDLGGACCSIAPEADAEVETETATATATPAGASAAGGTVRSRRLPLAPPVGSGRSCCGG
jgi:thioredoxin reductase